MEPFRVTASVQQREAAQKAMEHLAEDMSYTSSIHFDQGSGACHGASPLKNTNNNRHHMAFNATTVETAVLMVRYSAWQVVLMHILN